MISPEPSKSLSEIPSSGRPPPSQPVRPARLSVRRVAGIRGNTMTRKTLDGIVRVAASMRGCDRSRMTERRKKSVLFCAIRCEIHCEPDPPRTAQRAASVAPTMVRPGPPGSFRAKRLDRLQSRRLPGRVPAEQEADRGGETQGDDDRESLHDHHVRASVPAAQALPGSARLLTADLPPPGLSAYHPATPGE